MPDGLVFAPIAGAPPTIEWVPIGGILIDEDYQRSIDSPQSKALIVRIACGWDWRLFDPIRLSKRGDTDLYVIDGQHRLAAAKLRGDLPHLPAIVGRFESAADEAKLFVAVNTLRKTPTALDKFRARCVAGDANALAVSAMIEKAGWRVGRSQTKIGDGEIICVRLLERLRRRHGEAILLNAMIDFAEAFPGEGVRVGDEMLPGLCLLLAEPPHGFDPDALIEKLKAKGQSDWALVIRRYHNGHLDLDFPAVAAHAVLLAALSLDPPEEPAPFRAPLPPPFRAPTPQSAAIDAPERISVGAACDILRSMMNANVRQDGDRFFVNGLEHDRRQLLLKVNHLRASKNQPPLAIVANNAVQ